jgi:hydrogenase nickel incorporation protein HypA/HybF
VHELAVTESLLEIALRHGRAAGARRVTDLYLVIGQLSTYVDDSVQFYWDFVSQGTEAEGARLHFRRVPASFTCQDCGRTYALDENQLTCPECGGSRVQLGKGDEFYLETIEVEGAPEAREQGEDG